MILALDLARQTGWAAGEACGSPIHGTFRIEEGNKPFEFRQMAREVQSLIVAHQPKMVIIEAPYVGRTATHNTLLPLFGYRAAALMTVKDPVLSAWATPSQVRKHFIGHGGLKRSEAKKAVMEKCQWRGWKPDNDDEADALALWDYACAQKSPEHLAIGMVKGSPGVAYSKKTPYREIPLQGSERLIVTDKDRDALSEALNNQLEAIDENER